MKPGLIAKGYTSLLVLRVSRKHELKCHETCVIGCEVQLPHKICCTIREVYAIFAKSSLDANFHRSVNSCSRCAKQQHLCSEELWEIREILRKICATFSHGYRQ